MPLPFELHELAAFVAVAELGSVTAAAARLRIAQPALSRKIKQLESSLKASLFIRAHNRIVLTAAGRRFLPDARYILEFCTYLQFEGFIEAAAAPPASVPALVECRPRANGRDSFR